MEDVGDYYCTASNGIESVVKFVPLRIQGIDSIKNMTFPQKLFHIIVYFTSN